MSVFERGFIAHIPSSKELHEPFGVEISFRKPQGGFWISTQGAITNTAIVPPIRLRCLVVKMLLILEIPTIF